MTHCTVTTSRNSQIVGFVSTVALLVCLGSAMIGIIPTLETVQTLFRAALAVIR